VQVFVFVSFSLVAIGVLTGLARLARANFCRLLRLWSK